jgi:hypothetical protein
MGLLAEQQGGGYSDDEEGTLPEQGWDLPPRAQGFLVDAASGSEMEGESESGSSGDNGGLFEADDRQQGSPVRSFEAKDLFAESEDDPPALCPLDEAFAFYGSTSDDPMGELERQCSSGRSVEDEAMVNRVVLSQLWDPDRPFPKVSFLNLSRENLDVHGGVWRSAVNDLGCNLRTKKGVERLLGKSSATLDSNLRAMIRALQEAEGVDHWSRVSLPVSEATQNRVYSVLTATRTPMGTSSAVASLRKLDEVLGLPAGTLWPLTPTVEEWLSALSGLRKAQVSRTARALLWREWSLMLSTWWGSLFGDLRELVLKMQHGALFPTDAHARGVVKALRSLVMMGLGLDLAARGDDLASALVEFGIMKRCAATAQTNTDHIHLSGPVSFPLLFFDAKMRSDSAEVARASGHLLEECLPDFGQLLLVYLAIRYRVYDFCDSGPPHSKFVEGIRKPRVLGIEIGGVVSLTLPYGLPRRMAMWRSQRSAQRFLMVPLLGVLSRHRFDRPLVASSVRALITKELNARVNPVDRELPLHVRRRFTAHSLRQSNVLWAMEADIPIADQMRNGRWKTQDALMLCYNRQRPALRVLDRISKFYADDQ